jgi:hypothetical protein
LPTMLSENIHCPKCGQGFRLTYNPQSENWSERVAPELAKNELGERCPDHTGSSWEFLSPEG